MNVMRITQSVLARHTPTPLIVLCLAGLLAGCGGGSQSAQVANSSTANYRVTFKTTWTQGSFPTLFPSGRHFTGLVGATHNRSASFWQPGRLATRGIEDVAELGSKAALLSEVGVQKQAGNVFDSLSGDGIPGSVAQTSLTFTTDSRFPLVTLVSMVAPSPDWFVGVHDLELYSNGQWKDRVDVNLEVYDSGSDSGVTFTSPDAEATPHVPIGRLSTTAADTDFDQGIHRTTGEYVATFSFERL